MTYTIPYSQLNKTRILSVGGKGAHLGEMIITGFPVPAGFVQTTATLTICLAYGEPKGLRPAQLSNWIGKAADPSSGVAQ